MSVLQDVRPGTACNGERWRRPANRGGYNTGGGSHFGSGLTINTAAGLYEGMIVLTHNERYW